MKTRKTVARRSAAKSRKTRQKDEERRSPLTFSGSSLQRVRIARGLSVEDLGERALMDSAAVTVFEAYAGDGCQRDLDVIPSADHALALACALDVPIAELCDDIAGSRRRFEAWRSKDPAKDWSFSGSRLRAARVRKGWSAEELASRAGVPVSEIQYVEDDENEFTPTYIVLRMIAKLDDERPFPEALARFLVKP